MTTPPDGAPAPLQVCAQSEPQAIAHAIVHALRTNDHLEVHATGALAVNCAVQGIAIASTMLGSQGISIHFTPIFLEHITNGDDLTRISLIVRRGT
jgi:stage V sporulation protein SpoVS